MIVSHEVAMWIVTAAVVGVGLGWAVRDIYLLFVNLPRRGRARWADQRAWRDQIFGSVLGLVLIGLGLWGVVRYHSNH